MERRIPENPRYAHVRSRLDTGLTVDKVKYVTAKEFLRRRDEPYYRVTPGQLFDLLSEYEQDLQEGVQDMASKQDPDSHGPVVVTYTEEAEAAYDRPYLILDLRTPEEYTVHRVAQARSFPIVMLNQDRMTAELFKFKNREGTLIVLYEDEERLACQAAQTLLHRGFDNVYVLSGGLQAFTHLHPDFIEGTPPVPKSQKGTARRSSTGSTGAASVASRVAPSRLGSIAGASTRAPPSRGSATVRSLASHTTSMGPDMMRRASLDAMRDSHRGSLKGGMSQGTTLSVAESVISRATSRRGR
ncbi:Rhodanese-like domain-containing protein [Tribonema minus]|uniref:Rhodanese-like domain-containing protein n=1 Tax=Tribonema minus TaxID=303371 RepID=A0A835ZB11_9STRA|nr:Rhodanese-like domain-containing protein [Tribonema minus]